MASYRGTLYTCVSNDLVHRVYEHRQWIHNEVQHIKTGVLRSDSGINSAISREKQSKRWLRSKKMALIESTNPYWVDLAEEWDTNPKASPDPSSASGGLRVTEKPVYGVN